MSVLLKSMSLIKASQCSSMPSPSCPKCPRTNTPTDTSMDTSMIPIVVGSLMKRLFR